MKFRLAFALMVGLLTGLPAASAQQPSAQQASSPPPDSAWSRYPSATAIGIENAVAIVRISSQIREDSAYVVVNPGPLPNPEVRVRRGRLVIDGGLDRRIESCLENGAVRVRGHGAVPLAQLPVIYVRTPESLVLEAEGALMIEAGPSTSARVGLAGCAVGRFGAVTDQLSLSLAGSAAALVGPSARARVAIAGDGYAAIGPVDRGVEIAIAGHGFVRTGPVSGPVRVAIQGNGLVDMGAGQAENLRVAIAGDGHVRFAGDAGAVSVAIAGSGLVEVAHCRGEIEQRIAGSGTVRVGPLSPATGLPPAPTALTLF
jgi:Putative auto-transporter adhesin, head GIN domain